MIKSWKTIETKPLGDFRVFTIRSDTKISPRTGAKHDFFVIDSSNWVNVIALTPDRNLVLTEQFRQGTNTVELELPGGVIDATDASPEVAAIRELREETGYEGERARIIGNVFPNPAIMSNTCYTVLVENCRFIHPTEFDGAEDLATILAPVEQAPTLVAEGKIRHALMIAGLYHFSLLRL